MNTQQVRQHLGDRNGQYETQPKKGVFPYPSADATWAAEFLQDLVFPFKIKINSVLKQGENRK